MKGQPNVSILEIGSYQGRSAVWLLENILTHPTSRLTCIDTFAGSVEHTIEQKESIEDLFDHNTQNFQDRLIKIKGKRNEVLRILNAKYDMIYIDGDHRSPYVLMDLVLAFPLLKVDGKMICDDYGGENTIENPRPAIDAFMYIFQHKISVYTPGWQLAFTKLSD